MLQEHPNAPPPASRLAMAVQLPCLDLLSHPWLIWFRLTQVIVEMDLASLQSVRDFAEQYKGPVACCSVRQTDTGQAARNSWSQAEDVLVHNAAVLGTGDLIRTQDSRCCWPMVSQDGHNYNVTFNYFQSTWTWSVSLLPFRCVCSSVRLINRTKIVLSPTILCPIVFVSAGWFRRVFAGRQLLVDSAFIHRYYCAKCKISMMLAEDTFNIAYIAFIFWTGQLPFNANAWDVYSVYCKHCKLVAYGRPLEWKAMDCHGPMILPRPRAEVFAHIAVASSVGAKLWGTHRTRLGQGPWVIYSENKASSESQWVGQTSVVIWG